MQQIELQPNAFIELGVINLKTEEGEREFQPFEVVELVDIGSVVGTAEVTSFGHNAVKNITDINFRVLTVRTLGGELEPVPQEEQEQSTQQ
jgi:hypothetical protein